ncbi:MAG: hypothetical protein IT372_18550 [Polyangiaceae bacterium]|nr:hypothetical protein [Polyangiaceae bacterium]
MKYLIAMSLALAGCGSSAPKVEEPAPAAPAAAAPAEGAAAEAKEPEAEADSKEIPTGCAGDDASACVMPRGFVRRLCSGAYAELALMLFQKGSPWRRAYVAVREAAPFNGLNGPSSDEKLTFEEELLVLSEKKVDTGGMQVSGAGASFDLLRWDGTCVTLSAEEIRFAAPSKPKHATIPWRILEDATQNALLADEALAKVAAERKKECKGATMGNVTAKCEKADKALNDLVVKAVRSGTPVPKPAKVP